MIRVKAIEINNVYDARKEMRRIGVHKDGIRIMEGKSLLFSIKIEGIKQSESNIIKQEILSIGGDARVPCDAFSFSKKKFSILLFGTDRHYELLQRKLLKKPFNLPQVSRRIKETLENFKKENLVIKFKNSSASLKKTKIMGILNVTPDSFYDGGRYKRIDLAVKHALEMEESGADIIDIGGESSRPGAISVSIKEELRRVIPVIEKIRKKTRIPISIDTCKARVAKESIEKGADVLNDISSLRMDKDMIKVLLKYKVPFILMHMQGSPRNMQKNPQYGDVVGEIIDFFSKRIEYVTKKGISKEKIIIDPGIGFGKAVEHNLEILKNVRQFKILGCPILIGASRKSLIGKVLGLEPEERLEGSLALALWSAINGVKILRVHDVKETKRAMEMVEAVRGI